MGPEGAWEAKADAADARPGLTQHEYEERTGKCLGKLARRSKIGFHHQQSGVIVAVNVGIPTLCHSPAHTHIPTPQPNQQPHGLVQAHSALLCSALAVVVHGSSCPH